MTAALALGVLVASCGAEPGTPPNGRPVIRVQPASQSVRLGDVATFSVEIDAGSGPCTFQWLWNGWPVPGGTSPSFTARPTEVADASSIYAVVVSNAQGSVTSDDAKVTVESAPRAPAAGDLRFQGVGAAPFLLPVLTVSLTSAYEESYSSRSGTPLSVGLEADMCSPSPPAGCVWALAVTTRPPASPQTDVLYRSSPLADLEADLDALSTPDSVITSIDLMDTSGWYALSRTRALAGGGFTLTRHLVAPDAFGAAVTAEGAASRVVTAVSFHAGNVYFLSYGWDGDATTVYEAQVANATLATVGGEATALSAAGYIITAIGSDGAGGLVLVGTRVLGDSAARPLQVVTDNSNGGVPLVGQGYAIVGFVFDVAAGGKTWIGQQ